MKKNERLSRRNAVYTPGSTATNMINYSETSLKLEVEYVDGDVYHYLEVEPEKWEEYRDWVAQGKSSGEFVNKYIKPFYEQRRIEQHSSV